MYVAFANSYEQGADDEEKDAEAGGVGGVRGVGRARLPGTAQPSGGRHLQHQGWGLAGSQRLAHLERGICEYHTQRKGIYNKTHTPSIEGALPPNSARFGYATEGALFISAQLSSDAVSALRKVWVLTWLWKQPSAKART